MDLCQFIFHGRGDLFGGRADRKPQSRAPLCLRILRRCSGERLPQLFRPRNNDVDTIFESNVQRKFTAGDLIMLDSDLGVDIGTRITLDKVTLVGSRDFTLLGRPVLPRDLVRVEATVVEKNLSKTEVCNSAVLMPQSDLMNSCSNSNWLIY